MRGGRKTNKKQNENTKYETVQGMYNASQNNKKIMHNPK
jgi:hypothetical protein